VTRTFNVDRSSLTSSTWPVKLLNGPSVMRTASPVLKSSFPTTASADWITIGIGGQYAYLSSGDVVDVKTKKIVAQMKDEYGRQMHSEKLLEISFSNGKLVRTVSQFAEGIPSAVQARLAGRGLTAQVK